MTQYMRAMIVWFSLCFVATTFVLPLVGWSNNKIDLSQILVNFILWGLVCYIIILLEKRRLKKLNKEQ